MIRFVNIAFLMLFFASCKDQHPKTNNTVVNSCIKSVSRDVNGDTSLVRIELSGFRFIVHYYYNKPQGILLQETKNSESHFMNDNRGVFVSINPEIGFINSVGYRYLKNEEGGDIAIDKLGNVQAFTSWQQYSNNGISYEMTEVGKGEIKVYTIKDGEKTDSSIYQRK